VVLKDCTAFTTPQFFSALNVFRAVLYTRAVRNCSQTGIFGSALSASIFLVQAVAPKIAAAESVTLHQIMAPMATDTSAMYEAGNLLRAPVLL
jgi:hypothetical protein